MDKDASHIHQQPAIMTWQHSFALDILRTGGVKNVRQALYINALSLDRLLALGASWRDRYGLGGRSIDFTREQGF